MLLLQAAYRGGGETARPGAGLPPRVLQMRGGQWQCAGEGLLSPHSVTMLCAELRPHPGGRLLPRQQQALLHGLLRDALINNRETSRPSLVNCR